MRPLLICCLLLLSSPLSAEEPPQEDICALLAKRLDEAPGGPGTEEHQAHGRFLLSQCIARVCFGAGVDAETLLRESANYQAAWAKVRALCLSPSTDRLSGILPRRDARALWGRGAVFLAAPGAGEGKRGAGCRVFFRTDS